MSTQTNLTMQTEISIHPKTRIGTISLTVSSLENQIEFYQKVLGFKRHWREGNRAGMGAGGDDLLLLTQESNRKRYRGVTGLYHVAYLFPERRELALAIARLFALKYPNSPTDHILTKTTYLNDPEGNGIELYCESPEDGTWIISEDTFEARRADGTISDGREPLHVEALFKLIQNDDRFDAPVSPELKIGHVHLHVRDVAEAVDFYHGVIGFDKMGISSMFRVAFVSAGGYHHHLGLNTWQGEGAPPPPSDALGLRYFTIDLPDQVTYDEVVARVKAAGITSRQTGDDLLFFDPSKNGVLLRVVK